MRRPILLIAVCAGFGLSACDSDSPVKPGWSSKALFSRVDGTSGITASPVSPSEIDLTWQYSSTLVTGFQVFRSTTGATGTYSLLASTVATATNYADVGLTESTTYCYELRAFRTSGRNTTYTSYSEPACATTKRAPVFPAPGSANATPQGSTTVAVVWTLGAGTASGFRVERSASSVGPWEAAATTETSARSYADVGRQGDILVCYHIVALYAGGESEPSNVDCTAPPFNPTNLVASPVTDAITLTWRDNSRVEDAYDVQRAVDAVTFNTLASLPANSTSYRDASVAASKTYWYRVQARKDGGASDNSNTISVMVPLPGTPNAPSNTQATPVSSSSIRVQWTDSSTNEDGFRVEQASSVDGPWISGGTAAPNGTSLLLSAASEQRRCYRVLAFNAAGNSVPSTPDCTAAPAAPTNLIAVPTADGIEVTWQDNSSWEFGYLLQSSADGVTFSTAAHLPANTAGFHQPGVGSGARSWYRVVATRDGGVSDLSNTASSVGGCAVISDTEVCDNGLDDNCDGLVDGADPACGETVDCNFNPCGSGTICNGSICVSSCGDGYKDSDESDVDCGGSCGTCQVDQQCWGNWDCASNNCVYASGAYMGVCQPPVSRP
jgi:titin